MIDQIPLRIEAEDIYFITGLSQRGELVNLQGKARGNLNVDDYIHIYFPKNNEKVGTQIPIKNVESISFIILLFTIVRVVGSISLRQASHVTMNLAVDCLTTVFDWCTTLLINLKNNSLL